MTLEELQSKLPKEWRPIVAQYGPAFVAMTTEQAWEWLQVAARGDIYAAHRAILAKLPNGDLLAEWDRQSAEWSAANERNAARMAWQRDAMGAVMRVLVASALAMVGL